MGGGSKKNLIEKLDVIETNNLWEGGMRIFSQFLIIEKQNLYSPPAL